jgi:hypothetical protein
MSQEENLGEGDENKLVDPSSSSLISRQAEELRQSRRLVKPVQPIEPVQAPQQEQLRTTIGRVVQNDQLAVRRFQDIAARAILKRRQADTEP